MTMFASPACAKWFDNDWNYRIKLTIDDDKVNGDLSNFPVYVDLGDLNGTGFFTNVANGGVDIRVTKSNGETQVAREIVELDKVTKTGELHFMANGTLSSTSNSDWYLYYGNPNVQNLSSNGQYGASNVWTNYVGVWHLNEDPSLDGARQYTAANSEYHSSSAAALAPSGNAVTVSSWFYIDNLANLNAFGSGVFDYGTTSGSGVNHPYQIIVNNAGLITGLVANGSVSNSVNSSITAIAGQWYFGLLQYNGSTLSLTVNETTNTSAYAGGILDVATSSLAAGRTNNGRYWDGRISKLGKWNRSITDSERSWLYNNGSGRLYSAFGKAGTNGENLKTNLVSYWNLNEASGNATDAHASNDLTDNNTVTASAGGPSSGSVRDLTSNGDAGTLVNMDFNNVWSGDSPHKSPQASTTDSSNNGNHGLMMNVDNLNARKSTTAQNSFDSTVLDLSGNVNHGRLINYDHSVAYDQSGNGNHGTVVNFADNFAAHSSDIPSQLNGKEANSLLFTEQNDRVNLDPVNLGGVSKTLASWVKTTSTDSSKNYTGNAALNVFGDTSGSVYSGFGVHGGKVQYNHYPSGGPFASVTGVTNVNDGNWHHIAVTHDHATNGIKLFVDGVEDGNGNIIHQPTTDNVNIYGDGYNPANDGFIGSLTGGVIYNSLLSPAQIASLANGDDVGTPALKYDFSYARSLDVPSGFNGRSLQFRTSSSQYVEVLDSNSLDITDNLTVSTFVRGEPTASLQMIASKYNYGAPNQRSWFLGAVANTGLMQVFISDDGTATNPHRKQYNSAATVLDGAWHNIAFTFNGGTLKLYIDGVEDLGVTQLIDEAITSIYSSTANLAIGTYYSAGTPVSFSNSKIDDLRIYSRVLDNGELLYLTTNGATGSDPGAANLAGHWNLDETNLRNLPSVKNGTSMQLDGSNDYIAVPHKDFMNSDDLSVGAWVNVDSYDTSGAFIFNHQSGATTGGFEFYINSSGTLLANPSAAGGSSISSIFGLDTWHHIGFTRNGDTNTWKLYFNGVKVHENVHASDINDTTGILRIGDWVGNTNYAFDGMMDDLRVYNTIKTPEEMMSIYQGTNVTNGLMGHWKFDEATARELPDLGPGSSIEFDGNDDYINIGNGSSVANIWDGGGTATAWFNSDDVSSFGYIFRKSDTAGWYLHLTGGKLRFRERFDAPVSAYWDTDLTATNDTWNHLAVVYNADSTANDPDIYLNGVKITATEVSNPSGTRVDDSSVPLNISRSSDAFDGHLDDMRLYSKAKTAAEIWDIYQGVNDTNGLINHWTFDDGPNASSDTGFGYNGYSRGSMDAADLVNGQVGKALDFDGTDDYINTADISQMDGASSLVVSAWMKRRAASDLVLVGKGASVNARFEIEYWSDGNIYFVNGNGGNHYGSLAHNTTNWHHTVQLYDGSQSGNDRLKVYMDGAQQSLGYLGTQAATTASTADNFLIGKYGAGAFYTDGFIDEVRITNTVLTNDWIKTEYNNQSAASSFYEVGPQESMGGLFDWLLF